MALINLTDPVLALAPVPQSTDVEVCAVTFAEAIAEDDKLTMAVRETFDGPIIGTLSSRGGNFVLDPIARKVSVRLTEKTSAWFKGQAITEANRVRTLTGTLLHETAGGVSHSWSGSLDIKFALALSWTRG